MDPWNVYMYVCIVPYRRIGLQKLESGVIMDVDYFCLFCNDCLNVVFLAFLLLHPYDY